MHQDLTEWLLDLSAPTNALSTIDSSPSEEDFELWFLANGGYINSAVEIASSRTEGTFLRVSADQDLRSGSTIISCPHQLTLSWPSAQKYHLSHIHSTFRPHVATRLFLMKEYLLKELSPWWPYIKSLPQPDRKGSLNTPLYYSSEDLLWIQGTNLEYARKVRFEAWRKEYDNATSELFKDHPSANRSEVWTWELYLWAATIVTSRSFPCPAVFNQSEGEFPVHENNDGRYPVLIPGLDLLNHNPSRRVVWLWNSSSCTIKTDETTPAGSQVWNNYGPKSNAELIMGYGFSLPDNLADHFSVGFSPAISAYIRATRARRLAFSSVSESREVSSSTFATRDAKIKNEHAIESVDIIETEEPAAQDIHWIRVLDREYVFSPHFLEGFSIAVENQRERFEADKCPPPDGNFWDRPISRNKLHVICALAMILQKGRAAIRQLDKDLPERPHNARQVDAARYRQGQLRILEWVLGFLHSTSMSFKGISKSDNGKSTQIMRLEHTMTALPKRLLKDFRNVLNAGLKTREPRKIRERGGNDFAFTIWLCGLCLYASTHKKTPEETTASEADLEPHLLRWLQFLYETYSENQSRLPSSEMSKTAKHPIEENEWFDPVRNQNAQEDLSLVATSYLDAVHAAVAKHPQSVYNDPKLTATRLEWCLNVVLMEGVWFPDLQDHEQEEDDEWVLFLEHGLT